MRQNIGPNEEIYQYVIWSQYNPTNLNNDIDGYENDYSANRNSQPNSRRYKNY